MNKFEKMKNFLNYKYIKIFNLIFIYLLNLISYILPQSAGYVFIIMTLYLFWCFICYDFQYSITILFCFSMVRIFNEIEYPLAYTTIMHSVFAFIWSLKYLYLVMKKKEKIHWVIIVFSLMIVCCGFVNFNLKYYKNILADLVFLIILYLVFVFAKQINLKKLAITLSSHLLLVIIISGIFAFIPSLNSLVVYGNDRFMSFFLNPNTLQVFCIIFISILMSIYLKKQLRFYIFLIMVLPLIVAGLFTKSKAFIIILILLTLIFIIFTFRENKFKGFCVLGVLLFIFMLAFFVFKEIFLDILNRFTKYDYENVLDNLTTGRYSIWKAYIDKWLTSPKSIIFGYGEFIDETISIGSHNTLISLLYSRGIIGLVLIVLLAILYNVKVKNKIQKFKLINLIPLFVYSVVSIEESILRLELISLLVICCLFVFNKQENSINNLCNFDIKLKKINMVLKNFICSMFLKKPKVLSSNETLDYILHNKCSIGRYGDGEIELTKGKSLSFQEYDKALADKLISIKNTENFLVCIPNVFDKKYFNNKLLKKEEFVFWKKSKMLHSYLWKKYFNKENFCGDAFISRFYIRYKNVKNFNDYIIKLRNLWDKRNIILVEGETSQVGIGNDLLDNAKRIKRIICPNKNAFSCYNEILESVQKIAKKDDLVLIALGPTATALAYDLSCNGIQALDMGHFDIEYEWYLMGATEKVPVKGKHVNECQTLGEINVDKIYNSQIIKIIKKD